MSKKLKWGWCRPCWKVVRVERCNHDWLCRRCYRATYGDIRDTKDELFAVWRENDRQREIADEVGDYPDDDFDWPQEF